MNEKNPFEDAPVIFSYTRAQAIEDGVLVDLTAWARETGFKIPVACTAAVWHGYVVPPSGTDKFGQSERGRAHDLLWMLYVAIKASRNSKRDQILYQVRMALPLPTIVLPCGYVFPSSARSSSRGRCMSG